VVVAARIGTGTAIGTAIAIEAVLQVAAAMALAQMAEPVPMVEPVPMGMPPGLVAPAVGGAATVSPLDQAGASRTGPAAASRGQAADPRTGTAMAASAPRGAALPVR